MLLLLLRSCRTEYMQRVLTHLHQEGVAVADMQHVMQQLPYTQGMAQLLQELQAGSINGQPCSCIILSDRFEALSVPHSCFAFAWQCLLTAAAAAVCVYCVSAWQSEEDEYWGAASMHT